MKKYKVCKKGIGKAIGFEGCNTERNVALYGKANFKYGLGIDCGCYGKWLYTSESGKEMLSKAIISVQKPRLELEKYKSEKKENKSLGYLIKNTVNICHEYIRLRDRGKNCISCNEPYRSDFDAGHFYPGNKHSSLKFDETNIHAQCIGCNRFNDGNESKYRIGLIHRFSKGYVDLIDSKVLLEKKQGFKWDRFALEEIREYYKQKLKELKK